MFDLVTKTYLETKLKTELALLKIILIALLVVVVVLSVIRSISPKLLFSLLIVAGVLGYLGYVFINQSTQQLALCNSNPSSSECKNFKFHMW
jgi:hypothetical protein